MTDLIIAFIIVVFCTSCLCWSVQALNVRQTRRQRPVRNAPLHGECVT